MAVTLSLHEIRELSDINLARVYDLNLSMTDIVKRAMHIHKYSDNRVHCLRADLNALALEKINLDNTISLRKHHTRKVG